MSAIDLPVADAAKMKKLARSVQRRLEELGNTVSLNHAYEALAAVYGHKTWAVMKSVITEPPESEQMAIEPPTVPYVDGEWKKLAFSPFNKTVVVHAMRRGDFHKTYAGIEAMFPPEQKAELKTIYVVDDISAYDVRKDDLVMRLAEKGAYFNLFDLPLGSAAPTKDQTAALVWYLKQQMVFHATGVEQVLNRIVAQLYQEFESRLQRVPTDGEIALLDILPTDQGESFARIIRRLVERGMERHAEKIQNFLSPRLEQVIRAAQSVHVDIYGDVDNRGVIRQAIIDSVTNNIKTIETFRQPSNRIFRLEAKRCFIVIPGGLSPLDMSYRDLAIAIAQLNFVPSTQELGFRRPNTLLVVEDFESKGRYSNAINALAEIADSNDIFLLVGTDSDELPRKKPATSIVLPVKTVDHFARLCKYLEVEFYMGRFIDQMVVGRNVPFIAKSSRFGERFEFMGTI